MSQEPYILITAETHAGGNHAQYRECLDPKWRAEFAEWRGVYKNPAAERYGVKKKRNWDYGVWMTDQNSQGVIGEVIFPNTVPPVYRKSIVTAHQPKPEDYQRCLAGVRAQNRWLKDFCTEDPARRAGIGVILPHDFGGMAEERRRKILGHNAVALYKFDLEALTPLVQKYGPTPALPARTHRSAPTTMQSNST